MSIDLSSVPETAPVTIAEPGTPLAQLWRNIFPWSDLNAQSPPERWLTLGAEILPSLAVLAAQGPDQPHLLQTDALARLLTVGTQNAVDKVAQQSAAGAASIVVNNRNLFAPGSFIAIVPAAGGATLANSQFYQVVGQGPDVGKLLIAPNLNAQANPGDWVVGVPAVWIAGQSLNVQVGNSIAVNALPAITIAAAQTVNIGNSVSVGNVVSMNIAAQSVTVAVNQPATSLGTVTAGLGAVGVSSTFTLPTGTHSVVIMLAGLNTPNPPAAGWANPTALQVIGVQSGNVYLSDTTGNPPPWLAFAIDSAVDTQIKVVLNGPTVGGASIEAQAFVGSALDTLATFVQNTYDTPLQMVEIGSFRKQGAVMSRTRLPTAGYDVTGFSAPAVGSQATVTLAASTGRQYQCDLFTATAYENAAQVLLVSVQLLDGATVIYQDVIGAASAQGNSGRGGFGPGGGYSGTPGNSMTAKFSALGANIVEAVNIGAFLF